MSTTGKIIVAVLLGAMFTCLAAGVLGLFLFGVTDVKASELVEMSPIKALQVGSKIARYEVPDGFSSVFSARLAGYEMVGYTSEDGHSHIYFFQLPADVTFDPTNLDSDFRESFPGSTESYKDLRVVDSRPETIAGQEVTLIISEGMNHEGTPFREVSAMFQGQRGQVLVVFSCPQDAWNQVEVETFLASIR